MCYGGRLFEALPEVPSEIWKLCKDSFHEHPFLRLMFTGSSLTAISSKFCSELPLTIAWRHLLHQHLAILL
ncbi:hypothetical protein S83_021303 [Arachis hypogaea]